ncbi:hypothetical protein OG21DRAFT_1504808, partial [Imleria badia]
MRQHQVVARLLSSLHSGLVQPTQPHLPFWRLAASLTQSRVPCTQAIPCLCFLRGGPALDHSRSSRPPIMDRLPLRTGERFSLPPVVNSHLLFR